MPQHTDEDSFSRLASSIGGAVGMILFGKRLKEKEHEKNPAFLEWLNGHYREAAFADDREGSDQHIEKLAEANGVRTEWLHSNVGILAPTDDTLQAEADRRAGVHEARARDEIGKLALSGQYTDQALENKLGELTANDETAGAETRIAENMGRLRYFEVSNEGDLSGFQAKRDVMKADFGLKTASAVIDLYDSMPSGEMKNAFAYTTEVPGFQSWLERQKDRNMQERMHELSLLPQPGEVEEYRLKTSVTIREIINDATDRLVAAGTDKESVAYKEALADYNATQQLQGQMVAGGFAYPRDYAQAGLRERPLARDRMEVIFRPYSSDTSKAFMEDLVDLGIFNPEFDGVSTMQELIEKNPDVAAEFAALPSTVPNGVFVQEQLRLNFPEFVQAGRSMAIEDNPEVMGSIEAFEALLSGDRSGTSEPAKNPSFIYGEFVNSLSEPFQSLLGFSGAENAVLRHLEEGGVPEEMMEVVRQLLQAQPDATRFLGPPGMQR